MEKNHRFIISNSLIKHFYFNGEPKDYCFKYVKYKFIEDHPDQGATLSMQKGNYFETLAIGSGRGGKQTLDLPRKKITKKQAKEGFTIGKMSIDQERIIQQSMVFKQLASKYQIVATEFNTQVPVYKEWEKDKSILLRGEMDMFPTPIMLPKSGLKLAIIDLKLTKSLLSEWGEYCYATPSAMDMTQGEMYHYLAENIDFELNDLYNEGNSLHELFTEPVMNIIKEGQLMFLLWVFDYKATPGPENKFIRVAWDALKKAELMEKIRLTVERMEEGERCNWRAIPHATACEERKCPMLETCEAYAEFKEFYGTGSSNNDEVPPDFNEIETV